MNDYKTIRNIAEIEEYIGSAGVVSFDFETSPTEKYRSDGKAALDAHKADITGVSLSVKAGTGRYIPLRHRVGKNASIPSVMAFLRQRVFQNPKTVKIAHNMAFEAMFLYKDGIVLQEPVYDTIVASQLTLKNDFEYRDLGDSGLKTLVPYLYGVELPKFEDVVGEHSFDELDPDAWDTCRYACADSDWALQLYYTFSEWFENNIPKHRLICEKIESPTAVFTGMMKYNGVLFDTDLMEEKKAEAEAHLVDLRAKLQAVIGNVDIGENCGTQAFKDYLYKTEKLPVLKTTTKYAEAADDEAMQLLRAYCKSTALRWFPSSIPYRNSASGQRSRAPTSTDTSNGSIRRPVEYTPTFCRWEPTRDVLHPADPICRICPARALTRSASGSSWSRRRARPS